MKRFPGEECCHTCRYYMTPRCVVKKEEGSHPGPYDSCAGWKKMTPAHYECLEDARNEAVVIRREMAEARYGKAEE